MCSKFVIFQSQEPEDSPIKTVLGSLARNSLASDTLSLYTQSSSANTRRRRRNDWRPLSIEDVPFRSVHMGHSHL